MNTQLPPENLRTRCAKCVMDISAKEIIFDENGVCNFCHQAEKVLEEIQLEATKYPLLHKQILEAGKGKKYDVLIGLSGGIDSSTALETCIEWGLRPLAFTIDNGWNDAKADENIMNLVEGLKVPFFRYTIDLKKFKEMQAAFMNAGLINLEIPTDHIITAAAYELAQQYGIKYIISGGNVATESIMPASWGYNARDLVHIKDVFKKFHGHTNLDGVPTMSLFKFNYYKWIKRIEVIYILDYFDYNRKDSIKSLAHKFKYKDYGEKHGESVFTLWFQNFYLYKKFGIDKRKAHLSSMINSGQITREEALEELGKSPVYPELGIEGRVLQYARHEHREFKTDEKLFNFISKIVKILR